jgi:uncharacterized cupredoxin-like copper-binding protein
LTAGIVLALIATSGAAGALPRVTMAPWVGHAHPAAGNVSFTVNLTDAPAYAPRFLLAAPGTNVSVQLVNLGNISHSFTLSSVSHLAFNLSWSPDQLNATFHAHAPLANVTIAPGHTGYANFSIPSNASFDSFEFVSVIPYQFQAGMWGLLNVSSLSPPLVLATNTTDSLSFEPAALAASPTQFPANIAIEVTNLGSFSHTFTLDGTPNGTISSIAYFSSHAALVNVTVPTSGNKVVWANFTVPKAGVYEFVCVVPGHFASGMYGFLYAGVPVPSAPAAPSTAVVQTWVLAGSLVLLAIGGLLVLVATFTGRLPRS